MKRVVIVGRGGSGKTTLATRLSALTGLPVIELDSLFWQPGLASTPPHQWAAIQHDAVQQSAWIMDGDLGPYDVLHVRLQAADTVIMLDFSLLRCAWRAVRRSRENAEFWHWLWTYRRRWRPLVMQAIDTYAPSAEVHVLRSPRSVRRFLDRHAPSERPQPPTTPGRPKRGPSQ